MNKILKTPVGLDCPTVSSEEFVAVDDAKVRTVPNTADKGILEFIQSSKNTIHENSDDKNEMKDADPVPTSSETRNIMKSNYLDAHFDG
ncbi:hypothetical protein TNCV_1156251 [Trichonephila clavipes]|nr:hypothetical protein TNCV_1156251 [Trichonephila clavipes]